VEYFTKLGETSSATLETITSKGPSGSSQSTSLRFKAGDLPPHPFRESIDKNIT
jgi:hypothetical protein